MGQTLENRAVIFAGGEVISYSGVLSRLNKTDYIIAVDSGYHHCAKLGLTPNVLIGDLDSIGEIPENIELMQLPTAKNHTDTTISVNYALEKGFSSLMLVGMLGGRIDHTLANIQVLAYCGQVKANAFITDGATDIFILVAETVPNRLLLTPRNNHYFSLLAFSPVCSGVTITGGAYPLDNYNLKNTSPRAVSNEFINKPVTIDLLEGTLLVTVLPKD